MPDFTQVVERPIELDARAHRTYHHWHVFVPGIRPGQVYGYRAAHPFDSDYGVHIDPGKVLVDPYGRAVVIPDGYSRRQARQFGMNNVVAMKNIVVDPEAYDWEGDVPYEALDFELPPAPAAAVAGWGRWLDTSRDRPEDIVEAAAAPIVRANNTVSRRALSRQSLCKPSY
jgi:pullulanase/glycogen debranching enzyme